ncbi:ferrous iron transport protein A [Dehalococcoidia bacterium]|nr:ferrous iron transport protein A [Dehalococcoidia bacterium]
MDLTLLATATIGIVDRLEGGKHFISRIAAMGFTPGVKIAMVQNYRKGAIIVYLRDTQVALGRQEAKKIKIKPA